MDKKLLEDRFGKFSAACATLDVVPEVLFARGTLHGKPMLTMLSGPRLNMETFKQLREDIMAVLAEKEQQLKGNPGPGTVNVSF